MMHPSQGLNLNEIAIQVEEMKLRYEFQAQTFAESFDDENKKHILLEKVL